MQKAWYEDAKVNLRGAGRFPNEYVICIVCGKEVQKIRLNQSTCLSERCQIKYGGEKKYRGLKAEHVYRNLG